MSYNSYIIKDEKIAIFDTVDSRGTDEWVNNIEECLQGESPDYLIISHLEPDHSFNIKCIVEKYPNIKLIGNNKTFSLLPQFFNIDDLQSRKIEVKEGDSISIGNHKLFFYMAPMVHWPEVMVTYEETEKVLFSADAFGKFGCRDVEDNWEDEARRFYINIVAKYGMQVQTALNKISNLNINIICPLHGLVLKDNLNYYIEKYDKWSKYIPEDDGILVAYASIHGNTKMAVLKLIQMLKQEGISNITTIDLTRYDMSEAISQAYKHKKLILAASSYNMSVFPPMEQFLRLLKDKNFQNRSIAIIENGTWAPSAARIMKMIISEMKDISIIEPQITIRTTLSENSIQEFKELVKNILDN